MCQKARVSGTAGRKWDLGRGTGMFPRTDTLASEIEQFKLESALLAPGERTPPWAVHDAPIQLLLPARFLTVRL